jgi:hypothetical protein
MGVVAIAAGLLLGPNCARAEETLAERKARIAAMSAAEKEELRRKKDRFDKFDEEKQIKLRNVREQIASDPNSDQLLAVMERYRTWLTTLTALERDELRGLQGQARVERIKELMEKQRDQRIREATRGVAFSREERERVYRWLDSYFKSHEKELLDALPAEARKDTERRKGTPFFHMMLFSQWMRHDGSKKPLPLDEKEIEKLKQVLPPKAQELFDKATDPLAKREIAHRLILASLPRFGGWPSRGRHDPRRSGGPSWRPGPRISQESLQKFFENELSDEERRDVTQHSGESMHRELMRLYFKKKFGSRRGGDRRGPGPPGDRRPERRGGEAGPPKRDRPPGRRGPDEGRF